jgi:hypothetical protein
MKEDKKPEEKKEEIKKEENNQEQKEKQTNQEEIKKEEPKKEEEKKPEEKKEEPSKKEEKQEEKTTGKPNIILLTKFTSTIDKYNQFLTDKDRITIAKVSKEFSSAILPKLKEINKQKLSEKEKELETMKTDKSKFTNEFTIGKLGLKALESLNDKSIIDYFKKDEMPNEQVLFIFKIFYQLINKEKDILTKDNNEFWKLFKENIIKNSEKGIGEYFKNELKNIDFSVENIHKIHNLFDEQKTIINGANIAKSDNTAGLIFLPIKDALEYIGINLSVGGKNKKLINNEPLQKYYEFIINKRKEIDQKLDKKLKA